MSFVHIPACCISSIFLTSDVSYSAKVVIGDIDASAAATVAAEIVQAGGCVPQSSGPVPGSDGRPSLVRPLFCAGDTSPEKPSRSGVTSRAGMIKSPSSSSRAQGLAASTSWCVPPPPPLPHACPRAGTESVLNFPADSQRGRERRPADLRAQGRRRQARPAQTPRPGRQPRRSLRQYVIHPLTSLATRRHLKQHAPSRCTTCRVTQTRERCGPSSSSALSVRRPPPRRPPPA